MTRRRYYSMRTGKTEVARLDLCRLRSLFRHVYEDFRRRGYFHQPFGYDCIDNSTFRAGAAGDVSSFFFVRLRKADLHPVEEKCDQYSEDDLFDVIELLHDNVGKPVGIRQYHDWCKHDGCTWGSWDDDAGRREFREALNGLLNDYNAGWRLTEDGNIVPLEGEEFERLLSAPIKDYDPENVDERVKAATAKFRSRHVGDREEAVRLLAGVLEFLRPKLAGVLPSKDEDDLFSIANSFGIRHHNAKQKTDYDKGIWLPWIFYAYLSTIHVAVRLLTREEGRPAKQ